MPFKRIFSLPIYPNFRYNLFHDGGLYVGEARQGLIIRVRTCLTGISRSVLLGSTTMAGAQPVDALADA
jgi:hypothetical protein